MADFNRDVPMPNDYVRTLTIPCFVNGVFLRTVQMRSPPMPDLYFAEFGKLVRFQVYERYDGSFYYAADLEELVSVIQRLYGKGAVN